MYNVVSQIVNLRTICEYFFTNHETGCKRIGLGIVLQFYIIKGKRETNHETHYETRASMDGIQETVAEHQAGDILLVCDMMFSLWTCKQV